VLLECLLVNLIERLLARYRDPDAVHAGGALAMPPAF
jgi:hypothetical protein